MLIKDNSSNPEHFFIEIHGPSQCLEYKINEVNNNGGFGIIYIGTRCKDNFPIAIKVIDKSKISKWCQVSHF